MLGMFKGKAKEAANRMGGRTDLLEACVAAAMLTANADGNVSAEELEETETAIKGNDSLRGAFTPSQIGDVCDRYAVKVKRPSGKIQLIRELKDLQGKPEQEREDVFLCALDVAAGDGNVSEDETKVLREIASHLGLKADAYL